MTDLVPDQQSDSVLPPSTSYVSKDKKRLSNVLRNYPERIKFIPACKKEYYKRFKRIKLDNNETTDYVVCTECNDKQLIKYVTKNGAFHLQEP